MATSGFVCCDPETDTIATPRLKFRNPGTEISRSDTTDLQERGIRDEKMKMTRETCVDQSSIFVASIESFGDGNGEGKAWKGQGKSAPPVSRIG